MSSRENPKKSRVTSLSMDSEELEMLRKQSWIENRSQGEIIRAALLMYYIAQGKPILSVI